MCYAGPSIAEEPLVFCVGARCYVWAGGGDGGACALSEDMASIAVEDVFHPASRVFRRKLIGSVKVCSAGRREDGGRVVSPWCGVVFAC